MDFLTIEEVAKILKAHTNTVYKMCRKRQLPSVKIGKEWRIDREKLAEFMKAGTQISPPRNANPADGDFKPGHLLVLLADKEEVWDYEARFFAQSIKKGCLLFKACWWQKPDQVRKIFSQKGVPVAKLEASGDMVIVDLKAICLKSGPVAAADAWRSQVHWALKQGHQGIIGSGSPSLETCSSRGELLTFEEALDGFLDGLPVKGICVYHMEDKASSDWDILVHLMSLHRQVSFRTRDMDVVANIISKKGLQ